jgi:predicted Zn-dependent protease
MADCMELFASTKNPSAVRVSKEDSMYAVQTKQPQKAREISQEFLTDNPDHIWALAVQMLNFARDNKSDQAEQIAQKIMKLSQKGQVPCYAASKFLDSRSK